MTMLSERSSRPRHAARRSAPTRITVLPPLMWVINKSGARWFVLGETLLAVMGLAVWAARHNPLAISALMFGIAAVLRSIPRIIQERTRPLYPEQRQGSIPED